MAKYYTFKERVVSTLKWSFIYYDSFTRFPHDTSSFRTCIVPRIFIFVFLWLFIKRRYKILCPNQLKEPITPEKATEKILENTGLDSESFRLGKTKVDSASVNQ